MNDGFIALWLLSMAAILYFTGWEEQVADGMPLRFIGCFLGAASVLHLLTVTINGEAVVSGSAVLAVGTALVLLILLRKPSSILFILFSSLLTGFMWTWVRYIYSMDPVFIIIHPRWDGPVLAGLFAGLLADRFRTHVIIVILSAVFALGYHYVGPASHSAILEIGSLSWWDGLVIALTSARVMSNLKAWIKARTLRLIDNRSGEGGSS